MLTEEQVARLEESSRRSAVLSAIGALVLAGSLLLTAVLLFKEAELRKTADELAVSNHQLAEKSEASAALARQYAQQAQQARDALAKFSSAAVMTGSGSKGNLADQVIASDPNLAKAVPRIYMHIARPSQKKHAQEVSAALQNQGFVVIGIDTINLPGGAPEETVVHFHNRDAVNQSDTAGILKVLAAMNIQAKAALQTTTTERYRAYGIYFGSDFAD